MSKHSGRALSRRDALMGLAASLAAFPLAQLLACEGSTDALGDGEPELLDDDAGSAGTAAGGDAGSATPAQGSVAQDGAVSDGGSAPLTGWATGGTAAMLAKASYPNPFAYDTGSACALSCEATIGPCHTTSPLRSDVSDGWDGLPVRMSLRVVDTHCAPVAGALVEIWHTNYRGIYSGSVASLCNTDAADKTAGYFRGYQVTDSDGRVDFDSTFPGWYTSRAVHVHVRVLKGDYQSADGAEAWVITQLLFEDSLVKSIFANQLLYKDKGQPDTLLSADNVIGGTADKAPYVFDVAQMSDGAMLVSKTLVLRSALSDAVCSLAGTMAGGGGMMPPGGPP